MKKIRRFLAALSAAAIAALCGTADVIVSNVAAFADDEEAPDYSVIPEFTVPIGSITVDAGALNVIEIPLKIVRGGYYRNVTSSLTCSYDGFELTMKQNSAAGSEPGFSYFLKVPKTTLPGKYQISFSYSVYDYYGNLADTQSMTLPLIVKNDIKLSGLVVSSYSLTKDEVRPGDAFDLIVNIKNESKIDIENAAVTLDGLDPSKFVLDKGFTKQYFNIKNGETSTVRFSLIACKGIAYVRENLFIKLNYNIDNSNAETARESSTAVIIKCLPSEGEEETGKFDLTMTDYSVSSQEIKENTKFGLTLTLKNNSKRNIENARVSLTGLDGSKFAINEGLNYRDFSIKAGETKKISFSLIGCAGITNIREVIGTELTYGSVTTSSGVTVSCSPAKKEEEEKKDNTKYDLIMTNYSVSSSAISENTKFTLSVTVKNTSSNKIDAARVSVGGTDGTKFAVDSGLGYTDFAIEAGASKKIDFSLIGCKGIASTKEVIPILIEYGSVSATANTTVSCVLPSEKIEAGKYDVSVTDYSVSVSPVAEGSIFTLTAVVKNNSKNKIENIRLSLNNLDGVKFAADKGLGYSDFDLGSGETKTVSFGLVGCAGISSIREVIPIELSYGNITSTANATVTCKPKDEKQKEEEEKEKSFAPNIIIESYDFGGAYVIAGQTFPLNIKIKNMSDKAIIENLKVTINGASNSTDGSIAYSPANSSNSFFFETLGTKAEESMNIDFLAKSDAAPNSYPVEIAFSYEYSVGKERFKAEGINEKINIPLQQEDRLSINDPEIPGWTLSVGEPCQISTSLVNKGKSDVYNVSVRVEGDGFSCDSPNYYIGNIKSGSEEIYDARITPEMDGEIMGEIVFVYEDSNGVEKEARKEFTLNAMMMDYGGMDFGMDSDMDMDMPEEEEGPNWILIACIAGGGAIVLIIIIVIIVKAAKKKKAELEDDDEDI